MANNNISARFNPDTLDEASDILNAKLNIGNLKRANNIINILIAGIL